MNVSCVRWAGYLTHLDVYTYLQHIEMRDLAYFTQE